jgi:protein TonB
MFNVVTDRRKRRVWTPRTVAASAGAHLVLLGIFVTAAESTPADPKDDTRVIEFPIAQTPAPPKHDPAPTPPAPDKPQPVKGDFVTPRPPESVPTTIPAPDPHATPLHDSDVSGTGVEGDVIGTPDPHPQPPTGNTDPQPDGGDAGPYEAEAVTVLPHIANEREAQRMLQRAYPPVLRDAGVTGHATVVLIIDKDGNVEPGSVRVQDASHPAFEDAAKRAVERFHFTPAQLNGHAVAVVIALPIEWQLQH